MNAYLNGRELSTEIAKQNGWYPSRCAGDPHARIVIPAVNQHGMAYWQARSMDKSIEPRFQSPAVPRGDSIIVVYPLKSMWLPVVAVTEGPFDALAAAESGILGISIMGINPTNETLEFVMTYLEDVQHATFFADRDALEQTIELVQRFLKLGRFVSISSPQPYKDLASVPRKVRVKMLEAYTSRCMK